MTTFILGLIVFFTAHGFTAFCRKQRDGLVAKLGKGPYQGLYSLVSLAGFILIIVGWRHADVSALYQTPVFMRYVTEALMAPAIILLVAAYLPAGKIAPAVKHPMLAGVKIWAFAHLLVNGEIRSVLLFGSFLAFGIADRIAVKKRNAPIRAAGPVRNDVIAVVVGLAAYAAIALYLHRYIAGVRLF